MRNFLGPTAFITSGIALAGALIFAFTVPGLIGRIGKLEADLAAAQAKIGELTSSQTRLSASIDTANRSIQSLRSDLNPRVRDLNAITDTDVLQ